ncbi:MAG: outer membrane beta-barrel protein [Chitinophagaceae bacterium]|nr:outer membrane beta-barrel protein [Chitinophagaceae bacterium]
MKQNLLRSVWKYCSLSFLTLVSFVSFGQYTESTSHIEIGITAGPSNFLGDLGGNMGRGTPFLKDNNFPMTKLTWGGFVSYHPNELLAFRLALNFGSLEGDDAIIKPKGGLEEARKTRNSNFRSKFQEALFLVEVYPTIFLEEDPNDNYKKFRPYVTGGIGAFHFNPQGFDPVSNQWVGLKALSTEGQGFAEFPERKPYKLTQMNVPLGIGVKYFLSDNVNLSFEIIHRKTFTDYIDDVSTNYIDPALFYTYLPGNVAALAQRMANKTGGIYDPGDKRGTPTNNDAYYSAGFKLGIRLGDNSRYGNSTNCPIRF